MAFGMAKLVRKKSNGAYSARKVIPRDVRADYRALYSKSTEELFRAPASESPTCAKALCAEWLATVETRISSIRAKQRGEGRDLTQREARALAGECHHWFVRLKKTIQVNRSNGTDSANG
jgi:hypothetical protein